MGRYSSVLAPLFADFAALDGRSRVLDVGCGPGAFTGVLVDRLGAGSVVAIDPSEPFVAAVKQRFPGVEAHHGSAETLPFPDAVFDATLAQLVVHHMADPVAGIAEMARVTIEGGVVAACVWDLVGGRSPLGPFWRAVTRLDPSSSGESNLPGTGEGQLAALFREAGGLDVVDSEITFEVTHESFEEWWDPFLLGVGPAGRYLIDLDPESRNFLAGLCLDELGSGPFTLSSTAWAARGVVTG